MTRRLALAILLLAATIARAEDDPPVSEPAHPLGAWARLAGATWHAKGEWTGGAPFEGRMVAEWGLEELYLRVPNFIPVRDGEYLRYDSIYFVPPDTGKPTYVSAAFTGEVVKGEFEVEGDVATFIYPGPEGVGGTIRSVFTFEGDDKVRWVVHQRKTQEDEWSRLIDVVYEKEAPAERKRIATKPPEGAPLEFLEFLTGESRTASIEDGALGFEARFGITNRWFEMRIFLRIDGEERLGAFVFVWLDDRSGKVEYLGAGRGGTINQGAVRRDGEAVVLDGVIRRYDGKEIQRRITLWPGEDGSVISTTEEQVDGEWLERVRYTFTR